MCSSILCLGDAVLTACIKKEREVRLDSQSVPSHEKMVCLFPVLFLLTVTLLDSGGSLREAEIRPATRPGALHSAGDAEEIPPAGVWSVGLSDPILISVWTGRLHDETSCSVSTAATLHSSVSPRVFVFKSKNSSFTGKVFLVSNLRHVISSCSTLYPAGHALCNRDFLKYLGNTKKLIQCPDLFRPNMLPDS